MEKTNNRKIIMITGAGRGIGRAIALRFASEGCLLVLISRSADELESVSGEILRKGLVCLTIAADISKEKDIKRIYRTIIDRLGNLDILVNNAGRGSIGKPLAEISTKDWNKTMDTNMKSVFIMSREALRIMIPRGKGKIINIASMASRRGISLRSVYSASKFGVLGLTESMAAEVKHLDININAVNPGMVETKTFRKAHPDYNEPDLMHPDDIARVVTFLASEDAAAIKGSIIDVSNGQHLN